MDDKERRSALTRAIIAQTAGIQAMQVIKANTLFVLYSKSVGISDSLVLFFVGLSDVVPALLVLPAAYFADRVGKKRIGTLGTVLTLVGFAVVTAVGSVPESVVGYLIGLGVAVWALGQACFSAGWISLLSPLILPGERGRFFGSLRVSWQLVAVAYAGLASLVLAQRDSTAIYQLLFLIPLVGLAIRVIFYRSVPDVDRGGATHPNPLVVARRILKHPGTVPFATYAFILLLFTFAAPQVFALLEKEWLQLGSGTVVLLANVTRVGALVGFWFGGRLVDRHGARPFFVGTHALFGVIISAFAFHSLFGALLVPIYVALHAAFGIVLAVSAIVLTAETLSVSPSADRAFGLAMLLSVQQGGRALSGLLVSALLGLDILNDSWSHGIVEFGRYDSVLLLLGLMTLVMLVTLGLVPSVAGRTREHTASPEESEAAEADGD
jgi:MFS family permease